MSKRIIIRENNKAVMYYHKYNTGFSGCQCFKDCYCSEKFVSECIEYYKIIRSKNGKGTVHKSIEDANERWEFVNSL